jgi:hypothetical protein
VTIKKAYLQYFIFTLLILLIFYSPAYAAKKKYDKIRNLTEYSSRQLVAKYNFFSGNSILYNLVALSSVEKNETKVFLVFKAFQRIPLFDKETPLYLLIDDSERKEISPLSSKSNDTGGISTYWGFGVSSYRREIFQKAVYEIDGALLHKISLAKRIDARIEDTTFRIDGWSLKKLQEVAIELRKEHPEFYRLGLTEFYPTNSNQS